MRVIHFLTRLTPSRIVLAVAALWGAALAYSTASARSLHGDGAFFLLVHLYTPQRFNDYDPQRSFASFISQSPVLAGQKLGFDSVAAYAALYSLGMFVVPALAMVTGLYLVRRQTLLFAATGLGIVVYGFGTNFINTEANLMFGFVWLSVAILALDGPAPLLRGLVLPVIAIALLRSYEGMALVGPLLAAWAILALKRAKEHEERIGLVLAALLFILGTAIGIGGVLSPRDPYNAANFMSSALAYVKGPHLFLLLAGLSTASGMVLRIRWARSAGAVLSVLFGASFVAALVQLEGFYSFNLFYNNRAFMVLLLPAFVASLLAVQWRRPEWLMTSTAPAAHALILIPVFFAVSGDAVGTYRWNEYVLSFCNILESKASPVQRFDMLKHSGVRTAFTWTQPNMSVLLRDLGSSSTIANEPGAPVLLPAAPDTARPFVGLCQSPLLGRARWASFETPMSFSAGLYPGYVASVVGLRKAEAWGTWSEGPSVKIRFARQLPKSFDLTLQIGSVLEGHKSLPVTVIGGEQRQTFTTEREPKEVLLRFRSLSDVDALSFYISKPELPSEIGQGSIAFYTLLVTPVPAGKD